MSKESSKKSESLSFFILFLVTITCFVVFFIWTENVYTAVKVALGILAGTYGFMHGLNSRKRKRKNQEVEEWNSILH